jgi:hypothetical protein
MTSPADESVVYQARVDYDSAFVIVVPEPKSDPSFTIDGIAATNLQPASLNELVNGRMPLANYAPVHAKREVTAPGHPHSPRSTE